MALRNRGRKSDPHAAAAAVDAGPVAAEPVTAPAVFLGGLASEVDERAVAAPFEQIAAIAERVLRAYRDRHLSAEGTAAVCAGTAAAPGAPGVSTLPPPSPMRPSSNPRNSPCRHSRRSSPPNAPDGDQSGVAGR
jgi:hypothetical protein